MLDIILDIHQYKKIGEAQSKAQSASDKVESVNDRINSLEKRLEMFVLVNQTIVELLIKKCSISEIEILDLIEEIDLRDGVRDGKISNGDIKCIKCNRSYNRRLNKCLYCGFVSEDNQTIINKYKK